MPKPLTTPKPLKLMKRLKHIQTIKSKFLGSNQTSKGLKQMLRGKPLELLLKVRTCRNGMGK